MSRPDIDGLHSFMLRQIADFVIGDKIGSGSMRDVYVYKGDESCVIKIEQGAGCFQNVLESKVWDMVVGTKYAVHFAPVKHLSPDGSLLIMRRTTPAKPARHPERMPAFLCDFKHSNYGLLKGKLVCHDYGLGHIIGTGLTNRTRKADWTSG